MAQGSLKIPHKLFNNGGHVVILVFGQATTEDDIGLSISQGFVLQVEGGVHFVIHGIEGLTAFGPFTGVFARDDGNGLGEKGISYTLNTHKLGTVQQVNTHKETQPD